MMPSMKRLMAIFQKDIKDLSKNMFVSTSVLMPVIFAAVYGGMEVVTLEIHFLSINIAFVMVAAYIQCALIAEEKEKNTLRGLMLSPATIPEILAGKSLVSFILTIITIVLSAILTGYEPANFVLIAIAIIISTLFYLGLGTLLGLLTKSVVEASVVILPFFFIFGFSIFIEFLIEKYPIFAIAEYMPNIQLMEFAAKVQEGLGFMDVWFHLMIMVAWTVGIAILAVITFKKREMDY
ncbi:ABC transporter permease [Virgibacillus sp. MG-45]|uniref:ABC transporter permease n=1 Tax=Virgibacillus sp. MG-45 TaxID=3102791 RepID=UPI002ED921A2